MWKTCLDHSLKSTVFRSSFDSQQVKGTKTLVKSAWEQFYHIFSSFWGQMIWRMSSLVKFEIIGVFVNTLTPDRKYPFRYCEICSSLFKCNYVKNGKLFLDIFFHWRNLHQILSIFWKKMMLVANVLPILQTVKDLVRPLSKKRRFRASLEGQHVKGSQTLVKSVWEHF